MVHKFRMNRAVGVMDKGDVFTSDPADPKVRSLLGAGYLDDLGEVDDGEVRGESPGDATGSDRGGDEARETDLQSDRVGGEEDGPV